MSTKKKKRSAKTKVNPGTPTSQRYSGRSSQKIFRPSTKLDFDSWTHLYTAKFQQLWNESYLSILEQETNSKLPKQPESPISNGKNNKKRSSKKKKSIQPKSTPKLYHSPSSMIAIPKKGYVPCSNYPFHSDIMHTIQNAIHYLRIA